MGTLHSFDRERNMEQPLSRSNVLIVDDEVGPRESLRMILEPSFNVYTAEDGGYALETLEKMPIDVVTLDLRMPGMPGEEVLKQIKNLDPTVEVIIITGYGTLQSAVEAIRYKVFDYILKPFNVVDVLSSVKRCIKRKEIRRRMKDVLNEIESDPKHSLNIYEEITNFMSRLDEFYYSLEGETCLEFVRVLASALESKDPYTSGHSERVSYYSCLIADGLGLPQTKKENLQISAYLHDIGKVAITNTYIYKDGPLDKNEWAIIKQHPIKGIEIVAPLRLPYEVTAGIKHHHERFDGKGYPEGLSGKQIPLFARIIAIADAYDAMTVGRPYKAPLSKDEAMLELKRNSVSQFDKELVDVFLKEMEKK